MSWEEHRIYPELDLERRCRCNSDRLWREQQAGKAWLGAHLDCITPVRFGIGGADKGATECGGSMSNQLTVFSRGAFVTVCKGWYLREAIQQWSRKILQSLLQPPTYILLELHIILISLIIYKPSVTNFIWSYLHQFFDNSHGLNGYGKPLKRPFYWYQSHLKAISIGRDIRQINW